MGFKEIVKKISSRFGLLTAYRRLRENLDFAKVLVCNHNYTLQIRRLRRKQGKIRVLFIVSEISKWKEQKLYEEMERSEIFDPLVGISAWNKQMGLSNEELELVHKRAEAFFDQLGDRHVRTVTCDNQLRVYHDLSDFSPDIVFYTEQWSPCEKQDPCTVSEYALTFFAPYYVGDYCHMQFDCHQLVQRLSYGYFCLNETLCHEYRKSLRLDFHSCHFIPSGHPGLDYFTEEDTAEGKNEYVIYAPHFSFPNPKSPDFDEHLSTFDWNGREILEYAKSHPEMKWVFKPHPILREWILDSGFMDAEELADYYSAWASIGIVCENGNYQDLFIRSRVMITDSGSFLTEYGATGKPIIHLICAENTMKPIEAVKPVWDTYYKVHNLEEMYETFNLVLERGCDPNNEMRQVAVENAGIRGGNASKYIVQYMRCLLGR